MRGLDFEIKIRYLKELVDRIWMCLKGVKFLKLSHKANCKNDLNLHMISTFRNALVLIPHTWNKIEFCCFKEMSIAMIIIVYARLRKIKKYI